MGGYLIPAVLTLIAVLVAVFGSRFAARAGRPRMFRIGAFLSAVGLMLLWLLPWWVVTQKAGAWAMPLVVGAFVVAGSVLGGGLRAMATASTGKTESQVDRIVEDLSYLND